MTADLTPDLTSSLLTLFLSLQQWEQQQFRRSRGFLLRVRRSLGESSALYRQLVSLLQGIPAPSAKDLHQVSSLLALAKPHSPIH